ncbi:MAG TPA: hypothetical protein VL285_19550 [Bryobacteraceae bacterium]|nr:hypothetical protein [Bryobacteraceae bacterium]
MPSSRYAMNTMAGIWSSRTRYRSSMFGASGAADRRPSGAF